MSKSSLLGVLMNLGKSDIIQSVSPGGADAAIDWRGISNYIKTVRTSHVVTSGEVAAGAAEIIVVFATPFADANYTLSQAVSCNIERPTNDYSPGDNHLLAATGFDAVIYLGPGATAGDIVTLHIIVIHD
jgi:hypothetical protein